MPTRDLHNKPFDAGTRTKLAIYRSYVQGWLQVFLHTTKFAGQPLQFFDFFCGPGVDSKGVAGSPLILLEELTRQQKLIQASNREIRILFNDADSKKVDKLRSLCSERQFRWKPQFESREFTAAFSKFKVNIGQVPSFVFIDQGGVKHVTPQVFKSIMSRDAIDLIFFVASSSKRRFGDLLAPEIAYPENVPHLNSHRVLAETYRQFAPKNTFIGHFSIRKGSNIYGLVFASHHWLGMYKFLEVAWKLDSECGEADYQLEADTIQGEMDFELGKAGFKKRKVETFEQNLAQLIESQELATDRDVFLHCLIGGFLPRTAKNVYSELHKRGILKNTRRSFPRISVAVMKEARKIEL